MAAPPVEIAIAVVQHQVYYLIGLRPAKRALAGLWEFPGGKLHAGEAPNAAAERECLEETGLNVLAGAAYPTVEHEYAHGRLRLHFIACSLRDVEWQTPLPAVPDRFRWVTAVELSRYEFPPANAGLLELLRPNTD